MDDASERLMAALDTLNEIAKALTPDEAVDAIDTSDLQVFWRDWPHTSSWAGALWRRLNEDLADPATQQQDPELDEVGGPG